MCTFIKDVLKGMGVAFIIIGVLLYTYWTTKKETNRKDD